MRLEVIVFSHHFRKHTLEFMILAWLWKASQILDQPIIISFIVAELRKPGFFSFINSISGFLKASPFPW